MKMAKKNRFGFLSANVIKILAMAAMVIDHGSVVFLGEGTTVWRNIGRIAFPIFAFLIAEGAVHTKNRLKYLLRLIAFAFISEIPYDLAFGSSYFDTSKQNVYFTLALGLISIYAFDFFQKHSISVFGIITTAACSLGAFYLNSDYGFMGVVVITLMFIFSQSPQSVRYIGFALCAFMTSIVYVPLLNVGFIPAQLPAVFSAVPISLYNGKRGRKMNKYIFYAFYPAHFLLLYLLKEFVI